MYLQPNVQPWLVGQDMAFLLLKFLHGFDFFVCRSLIAAHELIHNGYEDVRVHRGGIGQWRDEDRC